MPDLYETLGVERNATQANIKKAFRCAAKKHHPDRAGGDHDKMVAVQKAYDILGKPPLRKVYDETGRTDGFDCTQQKVNAIIAEMFAHILSETSDIKSVNVTDKAKSKIKQGLRVLDNELIDFRRKITKLEEAKSRMEKAPENNLWACVIDNQMDTVRKQIEGHEENKKFGEMALTHLDDYEYRYDGAEHSSNSIYAEDLLRLMRRPGGYSIFTPDA